MFREDKVLLQCTCVHHQSWQVGLNKMLPACVPFICLPLDPLQCQNGWSVQGIVRCGCGMLYMFHMSHVCLQAGSSLHGPTQTADTPLPPSPVYKDSCEHFSWPLLEPQVLVICISPHMNMNTPVSCGLHQCCFAPCFSDAFWWHDIKLKSDFAFAGLHQSLHHSIISLRDTCDCHEMRQAKVCLWLIKQLPCMVDAMAKSTEMLLCYTKEMSCAVSASSVDFTAHTSCMQSV